MDSEMTAPVKSMKYTNYRAPLKYLTPEKVRRNAKIADSKKRKPHTARAIQRARDLKYDEGRGEEDEVDMVKEKFNATLSSRVRRPFVLIHTYKDFIITSNMLPNGRCNMDVKVGDKTRIAAKGAEYPAMHKHEYDIVMLHEVDGRRVHHWADSTSTVAKSSNFGHSGNYETIFY
jgi:hypothetical protein